MLRDRLFHRRRKSIRNSVKYCYADTRVEYMSFLEKFRKVEDEKKCRKPRSEKGRVNTATPVVTPDMNTEFSEQLKYQQQQMGNGSNENIINSFPSNPTIHF